MRTGNLKPEERIIVALDVDTIKKAFLLVHQLNGQVGYFKIGLQFIYSMIASLISPVSINEAVYNLSELRKLFTALSDQDFWDTKLADIPNTIEGASLALSGMGVKMFNIHASMGKEAIRRAVESKGHSQVFGVTVLTSLDKDECKSIFGGNPGSKVLQFSDTLLDEGVDGIICSPQEAQLLRSRERYDGLVTATPGVRPEWAQKGDQKRIMTPAEAIRAGADLLVIGRPIREPPKEIGSPADAARMIAEEIASVC